MCRLFNVLGRLGSLSLVLSFGCASIVSAQQNLAPPTSAPQFAVAFAKLDGLERNVQLTLKSNQSLSDKTVTHTIAFDEVESMGMDGKALTPSELTSRFAKKATPVLSGPEAPTQIDMDYFKALLNESAVFIVFDPAKADDDQEVDSDSSTESKPAKKAAAKPKKKSAVYKLSLNPEMEGVEDIREFTSISINGTTVPFGEKSSLGDANVYVQRKKQGVIVHGLPKGRYSVVLNAKIKPVGANVVEAAARESGIRVSDADRTAELSFEQ